MNDSFKLYKSNFEEEAVVIEFEAIDGPKEELEAISGFKVELEAISNPKKKLEAISGSNSFVGIGTSICFSGVFGRGFVFR